MGLAIIMWIAWTYTRRYGKSKELEVITPQNTSYNVKKCSEGFPFERLY